MQFGIIPPVRAGVTADPDGWPPSPGMPRPRVSSPWSWSARRGRLRLREHLSLRIVGKAAPADDCPVPDPLDLMAYLAEPGPPGSRGHRCTGPPRPPGGRPRQGSPPGRPTTAGAATASTTGTNGQLSYIHTPTGGTFADRARIVSFDRPYDHDWASGAADLVGNEIPVIYQAEQLGLDVTYWTDVDLHARPQLLDNHRALISLGHDEYWSAPDPQRCRPGPGPRGQPGLPRGQRAVTARSASSRHPRGQPPPGLLQVGRRGPDDRAGRPVVTVNWPEAPVSPPEAR